jgi:hypothetical protein
LRVEEGEEVVDREAARRHPKLLARDDLIAVLAAFARAGLR